MNNPIIWQPLHLYEPGHSFAILLDPKFAETMLNSKLSIEKYKRIQELPQELMGIKISEPYRFHKDTCFLRQINLNAGDGKWLSLDEVCAGTEPNFNNPIKYSTHNFDYRTTSSDVVTLMRLFDLWVEYSNVLRK